MPRSAASEKRRREATKAWQQRKVQEKRLLAMREAVKKAGEAMTSESYVKGKAHSKKPLKARRKVDPVQLMRRRKAVAAKGAK